MHGGKLFDLGLDGGVAHHLHRYNGVRDGADAAVVVVLLRIVDQTRQLHSVSSGAQDIDVCAKAGAGDEELVLGTEMLIELAPGLVD